LLLLFLLEQVKMSKCESNEHAENCSDYIEDALTIVVIGASGDLAKKKTYPALFALYTHNFLTERTTICGYARSAKTDEAFKEHLRPYLNNGTEEQKNAFLDLCIYRNGAYTSASDVEKVFEELEIIERNLHVGKVNRLFYFAIPPNVFVPIGKSLNDAVISKPDPENRIGWNRLIIEKPFGRDSESFQELSSAMSNLYTEDYLYRIDHYLGKEMVQNLVILRFSNAIFEPLWNKNHIKSVIISFKEDFGTKGRGGYFDSYGIIRDVIQNHLLQVMSLVAMEPPISVSGDNSAQYIRDEKVKVLNSIDPVKLEECVLGQYLADPNGSEPGYTEDPTVPDDSVTPTFASMVLWIKNPRWDGVPFIIKAGKAMNERKAEIRIQFKPPPAGDKMFAGQEMQQNELVMKLQPTEEVYMKTNVKSPGLLTTPVTSQLNLSYKTSFANTEMFDAYTRLILEVIRGKQATFVRDDELKASWDIFTPLLHQIEKEKIKPIPYEYGSRGPPESDTFIEKLGYKYHKGNYHWDY